MIKIVNMDDSGMFKKNISVNIAKRQSFRITILSYIHKCIYHKVKNMTLYYVNHKNLNFGVSKLAVDQKIFVSLQCLISISIATQ